MRPNRPEGGLVGTGARVVEPNEVAVRNVQDPPASSAAPNEIPDDKHHDDDEEEEQSSDNLPLLKQDSLDSATYHAPPSKDLNNNSNRNQFIGMLYVVLSSFCFSVGSVSIKHSSQTLAWPAVVFYSMIITSVMNLVRIKTQKKLPGGGVSLRVPHEDHKYLALRCVAGYATLSLSSYAMTQMVLTESTVILFTNPVLTLLLGACLLGEPIDRIDLLCSLFAYVGVVFVARPACWFPVSDTASSSTRPSTSGVICSLLAAGCVPMVYIALRKINHLHPLVTVQYFHTSCVAFSFLTALVLGVSFRCPMKTSVVVGILITGVTNNLAQTFLTMGFQRVNAGLGSIMRYFDVVFVFVMDQLVLGEHVSGYSVFGGSLVAMSAISVMLRRYYKSKKVGSS